MIAGQSDKPFRVRETYITDNPFRLACAGSSLTHQQLRRKADAALRSASVGLNSAPPLDTEFGSEDIKGILEVVRSLATSPDRRTAYRIMWPLSQHAIPHLASGEMPPGNTLTPEEVTQLHFLCAWFGFLRDKSPLQASEALNYWDDLYCDDALYSRFVALTKEDDNLSEDDAYNCVLDAHEQVARYLLRRIASIAAQEWESGNTRAAIRILEAMLDSPLDETIQEDALDPVIEIGERLACEVEQLTSELPPFRNGASTEPPREVVQLERLTSVLATRHPMVGGWIDKSQNWYSAFDWKMRGAALELNKQDDDEGALAVVLEALQVVRDPDVKERLLGDRANLEQILADKEREEHFAEVRLISDVPSLGTINGIGTMLYGSTPFPTDQRLRYSIRYFVFFYIPIVPLARYVVEPIADNTWKFFGTTKWTQTMRVHLATTITLTLIAIIAIWYSAVTSVPFDSSHESSSANSPSKLPVAAEKKASSESSPAASENRAKYAPARGTPTVSASDDDSGPIAREQRSEHLKHQLDALKEKIASARAAISSDDLSLDNERSVLESLKDKIDGMSPDAQVQQEVDNYNSLVRSYEIHRKDYNTQIGRHNAKLDDSRQLIKRHNAIVDELNKDR